MIPNYTLIHYHPTVPPYVSCTADADVYERYRALDTVYSGLKLNTDKTKFMDCVNIAHYTAKCYEGDAMRQFI